MNGQCAKAKPVATPALMVQRFVHGLNAIAEAAGLVTETRIAKFRDNDDTPRVVNTWRGPRKAFRAFTFFPPSMLRSTQAGGCLCWPGPPHFHPIFDGYCEVSRKGVEFEFTTGPAAHSIRCLGEVEIADCDDGWSVYHGSIENIIATGLCTAKQFPTSKQGSRAFHCSPDGSPEWITRRYPDGSYTHWRESNELAQARHHKHQGFERQRETQRSYEEPPEHEPQSISSPKAALLVGLADQLRYIASLVHVAAGAIKAKSKNKPNSTGGSSKLGRALDDLEYATNDIAGVMKQLLELRADGSDDDDDDDSNDPSPTVNPHIPSPSIVQR